MIWILRVGFAPPLSSNSPSRVELIWLCHLVMYNTVLAYMRAVTEHRVTVMLLLLLLLLLKAEEEKTRFVVVVIEFFFQ